MSSKEADRVVLSQNDFPQDTQLPTRATWVSSLQKECARIIAADAKELGATIELKRERPLRGEANLSVTANIPDDATEMGRGMRKVRDTVDELYPDATPHMTWVIDLIAYLGDVLDQMQRDDESEARYAPRVARAWLAAQGLPVTNAGFITAVNAFVTGAAEKLAKERPGVLEAVVPYLANRLAALCGRDDAPSLDIVENVLKARTRAEYDEHFAILCRALALAGADTDSDSVARQARARKTSKTE